ncbi:MAG: phosphinothricin N-acetyltransferase [Caulobacter sp.]|nr:phosphinothricin N-acetyltransferase [Caulobacter sp.]
MESGLSDLTIRPATAADAPALAAIYGHHCLHGFGTFEEEAPSAEEMAQRLAAVTARGLPYLVAERDGQVAGFAYAGPFRPRAAYRYTAEDSVYIAPDHQGQGVGKALLIEIIAACEALGLRQLMAVIGDSGNTGSLALHRSLGFEQTGMGHSVGFKLGRWVDIVHMQRALNGGDARPAEGPGLALREPAR